MSPYVSVDYYASFGGGGGIYLRNYNDGYVNSAGGSGGLGYFNGLQLREFNGNDGNKPNNIETLYSRSVRAGYGGGRRASRGGNALSYFNDFTYFSAILNGAGSGGSSGDDVPRENAINKIDNGPGSGAGYTKGFYSSSNKSSIGTLGGGGGGGVGGIRSMTSVYYIGYPGSNGGNGKIILRYS